MTYVVFSDTHYSQTGKVIVTTNPMRAQAASTDGWTRATKDDLGRVVTVETFSGIYPSTATPTGTVMSAYNANATTVTDQATKMRRSIVDGLGRLVRVDEPNSAGSLGTVTAPNQPTGYSYDSLVKPDYRLVPGMQTLQFVSLPCLIKPDYRLVPGMQTLQFVSLP